MRGLASPLMYVHAGQPFIQTTKGLHHPTAFALKCKTHLIRSCFKCHAKWMFWNWRLTSYSTVFVCLNIKINTFGETFDSFVRLCFHKNMPCLWKCSKVAFSEGTRVTRWEITMTASAVTDWCSSRTINMIADGQYGMKLLPFTALGDNLLLSPKEEKLLRCSICRETCFLSSCCKCRDEYWGLQRLS